jgi:hypothetical protein
MSKNLFFYDQKIEIPSTKEINPISSVAPEQEYKIVRNSFNVNKIILTVGISETECLVVLDDFHQEEREIPVAVKNGKTLKTKMVKGMYQSNITITGEDYVRFMKLTSIEE